MNCADFQNVIQDLARQDLPDNSALNDALAHAESCRACDALLREAEQLTTELRSLAAQHRSETPSSRVETALVAAFRRPHSPAVRIRKAGGWLAVSAAGLAAAALLLAVLIRNPAAPSPASPAAPTVAPRESNTPAPRELWADYALEGETPEDAAAAFIPLAAGFDPSWIEGGAIVRVILPRPALESLGLPVSADGNGNGEVVADMVVSYDGTPEAIRFVDWRVSDIQ